MTRTRTKIVCTMGPAVSSYEKILELIDAGMNVARLNMSHGTHEQHRETIEKLKKARKEKKVPLAILLDTKGPEIRVGMIKGNKITLKKGQKFEIVKDQIEGDEKKITLTPPDILDDIELNANVLFDDGFISSKVIKKSDQGIVVEIENGGDLKSQKGINIPHANLKLPAVTEQDISDIIFGCENDIDIIAASFIRSADHILEIKELLAKHKGSHILVIAKIESALGVKNFDSILNVSDGIMVARGDLGVELPLTQVPKFQKEMIRKCYQSFKSVVTATQMLESMMDHPRPTRAEVSDVANAIYDSTSAVMLSGETAAGKYPIEAVRIMRSTIIEAEKDFNYPEFFNNNAARQTFHDISSSVALAAIKTAYSANGKALIALTTSGFSGRVMSRFRPEVPIIAVTTIEKTYNQLAFAWGVVPVLHQSTDLQKGVDGGCSFALDNKLLHYGDLIIITSGKFGVSGTTNMMRVDSIGDVLVRGTPHKGERVSGKVTLILTEGDKQDVKGRIAILVRCEESDKEKLQGAIGIILQNHPDDLASEDQAVQIASSLGIPLITRADTTIAAFKEDQLITLDPTRGLVFDGIIEGEKFH